MTSKNTKNTKVFKTLSKALSFIEKQGNKWIITKYYPPVVVKRRKQNLVSKGFCSKAKDFDETGRDLVWEMKRAERLILGYSVLFHHRECVNGKLKELLS